MERAIKEIDSGKLHIEFILSPADKDRFEARALKHLAVETNVPGFRPGKAPVDLVRAKFSDETIANEIMKAAVREYYPNTVKEEKLETIESPLTKNG